MVVLDSCPKHNMVAYLEKTYGNAEFHEIIDFLARSSIHNALTVSLVVSTTFVEQFWMSAKSKKINNIRYITAKVAGKPVSISEASIRSDLFFDDADGIDSLLNQAIFDAIQLMGYEGDLTVDPATMLPLSLTAAGREYSSQEFIKYYAENGIRMLKIALETPQRNGVAKRMNETFNERAKSMRLHAGLTKIASRNSDRVTGPKIVGASKIVEDQMKKTLKTEHPPRREAPRIHKYKDPSESQRLYKESVHGKKAINEEMVSLEKNKTWSLVRLPAAKKALQSKWCFRRHSTMIHPEGFQSAGKEENLIVKLKKSLMIKGKHQDQLYVKICQFYAEAWYKRCAMDHVAT
ncbi:ribonuclease H-like domain, reverse transcriptase, RNA-dependent DNA polymerase [Tanacetum coccineum]